MGIPKPSLIGFPSPPESPKRPSEAQVARSRAISGRPPLLTTPDVEPSSLWWEAWQGYELQMLSEGKSASVLRNRRSAVLILARHATKLGGDPPDITKAAMQRYLLLQYKDRKGQGACTLHNDLRAFWRWYASEYRAADPMDGIPAPKGRAAVVHVLKPAEMDKVFAACTGRNAWETTRNLAIVWLMLESGLRRAEVAALDVSDMNLTGRTVAVRCGKGGKARTAVFGSSTAKALWSWLRVRHSDGEELFGGMKGERLTPNGLSQLLARIKERSGVQVRPHMLRHAWAHINLASGMEGHDLMQLAGWSSATMLTRYGAELAQERAIAAGRSIDVGSIIKSGRR